ncbi:MAG: hypothetical protein ACYCV7_16110 [Acidimicrobiales bacterium]
MRTTPLIGHKAWFGPRRLGWGLGPVSAEGWVVTLVAMAVALGVARRDGGSRPATYVIAGGFLSVVILKGTAPGGPRARARYEAATAPDVGT